MTFSVERFLVKEFDAKRYNCWHFVYEVWVSLTGQVFTATPMDYTEDFSHLDTLALQMTGQFTTLLCPESPCIVLMRRQRLAPHVGVYMNGKILHLNERGAFYAAADHVTAVYPMVTYHAPR